MASTPTSAIGSQRGYITLQGIGFVKGQGTREVNLLAGDTPPTVTDGYAIWQPVPRPLSRAVSVFQGYNPALLKMEVRIARWTERGWDRGDAAGKLVEADCGDVGWMAGEGFSHGASPVVYVATKNPPNVTNDLIPRRWQGARNPWVVSSLEWGNAWRNENGYRIYQEMTITLMQYISVGAGTSAPKEKRTQAGGWFVTTPAYNTAQKIASAHSTTTPASYRETLALKIIRAPQNKHLRLRSIKQAIKNHTRVWVPSHPMI